jgi:hypothetical protein
LPLIGGGVKFPPTVALRDSKEYLTTINHITPLSRAPKIPGPEKSIDVNAKTAINIGKKIRNFKD